MRHHDLTLPVIDPAALIRYVIFSLLFVGFPSAAAELIGRVVGVHDGDTVTILDSGNTQYKIRLAGIDSPELKQQFGAKAKESLSSFLYAKKVTVEWKKRDRYGRIVGKILFMPANCITPACLQPADANYEQIAAGMAWYYRQYASELNPDDRAKYDAAENRAHVEKRGLWGDPNAVPPWTWRRSKKNTK